MKNIIILSVLLFSSLYMKAQVQTVNFDSLIMPLANPSVEFQEYLVQLAWTNNPENRILDYNINIAEKEIDITKLSWADDVGLQFNINENNDPFNNEIQKASDDALMDVGITQTELDVLDLDRGIRNTNDVASLSNFPRYNLGVTVNLGRWMTLKKEIDLSREKLKIEEAELDQQKLELRAEVIRRYQAYLQTIEIYKIRVQSEEDMLQTYQLVQNRFKEGTADFEDFNRASSAYQGTRESTLGSKGEITQAKIDVEELIGIPLEYAIAFHEREVGK